MPNRPVIVVENDPFPRLLQAFLDPAPMTERDAVIAGLSRTLGGSP